MPDWLIEGDRSVLLLLAAIALGCVAAWWHTRDRRWLAAAAAAGLFAAGLALLDRLYVSDREQIRDNITQMAAAVRPNDFDAAFAHLARDFQYGTANRTEFRRLAESAARNRRVTELVVWDQQVTAIDKERGRADASFQFKVRGEGAGFGEGFFLCKSTWVREPDGRWRMQSFRVYPLSAADQPIVIPGVG